MATPSPERLTVARELHDGIAQDLVGIGYSLDLLLAEPSLDTPARMRIRRTRLEVDSLIAKVRREILNLRTPQQAPLSDRIRQLAASLIPDIPTDFSFDEVPLADEAVEQLLTISAEILRNIATHSRATHVAINLYPINNRTCLEICDNGIGGAQVKIGRFGLRGAIERVREINGSITIESIEGTRIALLI
ncbi:MAG: histidine kinase [Actinomycetota bacterium]|jgi:signal transduction histidine kinase